MQEYEKAVFISYAWGGESEEIVNLIDDALQQRGLKIIRDKRDLGYKGSISAFMERIGQGNSVIIVISDKYLRSPNCMFELVEIAEGKQFHDSIFPIVLSNAEIYDPVKRLHYVKHWEDKLAELDQAMRGVSQANLQGIREEIDQYSRIRDKVSGLTSILKDMNTLTPDLHRGSDFSEIYAGIERRMAEESGRLKPETAESPYMGLHYFDMSDAHLFYGREALTDELLRRVQKESFLAIVGASGSGKSSVARAGLIPAWKAAMMGTVHLITPTARPLESLAASLTRDSESVTATSTLMDDMQKDSRSLRLSVRKILNSSEKTNLLLVVDQFEETFTLCKNPNERKAFIENLLSLAEDENHAVHMVITLRADFYHHCFEYEGLRSTLETHQANIGAMTTDELREAIVKPAEMNSWDFQPGLVDLILQDVGTEPGALPLLSHALLETWKRRQGRTLTLQGYHESGGVKKAITQTAENVYDQLSPAEQTLARNIFLRLTELGEGVQDTRRRATLDELSQAENHEAVEKVLKTLTDARLVTAEQDSAEVAHEALIREWGTLRKWLVEDRESLRLHRHLTESAQGWDRNLRDAGDLYRGARLAQALEWAKAHENDLSQLEAEYLNASQAEQQREQRGMRTRKVIRIGAVAFVIENIVVVVVVLFLLIQTGYLTTNVPGNKVQHTVAQEETALDIARCYGANVEAIMAANPQIDARDTPLSPNMVVTVPYIGSTGKIYGPPCGPVFYTVVAGDTWQSIATEYHADLAVLREANEGVVLTNGVRLKIPRNSARGTSPVTPQPDATRINIPAGGTTITLSGTVNASGKVRYVLGATQGQTLSIKVTGPANALALAVYAPGSAALKAQDTTLTWTGVLPSTGDYFIETVSVLVVSNKNYTLEVNLGTPARPTTPTVTLLTLTVAANPNDYSAPGQNITFTYTIMNSGTATLGPAQFIVNDNRFPSPINCGSNTTTLVPNQSVNCSAVYVTTQAYITTDQIVSNATASGAGVATSQPAVTTIRYSP